MAVLFMDTLDEIFPHRVPRKPALVPRTRRTKRASTESLRLVPASRAAVPVSSVQDIAVTDGRKTYHYAWASSLGPLPEIGAWVELPSSDGVWSAKVVAHDRGEYTGDLTGALGHGERQESTAAQRVYWKTVLRKAGITERADQLEIAESVASRPVTSCTELDSVELNAAIAMVAALL